MGLLAPLLLWLLAPIGAFIVFLYLLKMRRTSVDVPSTMLWRRITADMQANHPWQKLRPTWLLVLQLLALAAVVAAAARPFVLAAGLAGQDLAVIVDNSASMGATDVSPTRLHAARERARKLALSLGRGDRMLLIAASSRTQAVSSLTGDRAQLAQAVDSIQQTQLASSMADALALAAASKREKRPLRVVILSDGTYPEPPEDVTRGLDISRVRIGHDSDNMAITMYRVDSVPGGDRRAYVRVTNYGKNNRVQTLRLKQGERLLDARELTLPSGQSRGVDLQIAGETTGVVTASLAATDALPEDNEAHIVLGAARQARVLIVGPGNVFLEQALAVNPDLEVLRATTPPEARELASMDLVVWDRVQATDRVAAAEWFVAAGGAGAPAQPGPEGDSEVVLWRPGVEVARYADLSAMRYEGFRVLRPAPWAHVLAEAGGKPIIVGGVDAGHRKISFGWDYLRSDLPLRVGFPILVSNVIEWLLEDTGSNKPYAPGEPVPLSEAGQSVKITGPDGSSHTPRDQDSFTRTETAGLYTWSDGEKSGAFAVNLTSQEQSRLSPVGASNTQTARGEGEAPRTNREVYGWFLAAALAVLTVEWAVFHRRL